MKSKYIHRPLIASILLLLIPFFGNIVSSEFNWSIGDFLIMGLLLFGVGLIIELINVKVKKRNHRIILLILLLLAFLYIWAELGVGIFFNFGS